MGLAASQARYLSLTARNSDLTYEAQQISQQRLALTNETQEVADNYTEAMNNTVLQATTVDGNTQQLTYDVITSQDPYSGLCMRIVDTDGNVVIPGTYIEVSTEDDDGNETTTKVYSASSFISAYMSDLSGDALNEASAMSLSELYEYYNENYSDSGITLTLVDKYNSDLVNDGEKVLIDANCLDADYLQQMLTSGEWTLQQVSTTSESGWEDIVWQGSTSISEVYYTADDAAAEAEYESEMTRIQKEDKLLELRLEQVQTQQESVSTELDSIKDIINKNIESSFSTFT